MMNKFEMHAHTSECDKCACLNDAEHKKIIDRYLKGYYAARNVKCAKDLVDVLKSGEYSLIRDSL